MIFFFVQKGSYFISQAKKLYFQNQIKKTQANLPIQFLMGKRILHNVYTLQACSSPCARKIQQSTLKEFYYGQGDEHNLLTARSSWTEMLDKLFPSNIVPPEETNRSFMISTSLAGLDRQNRYMGQHYCCVSMRSFILL